VNIPSSTPILSSRYDISSIFSQKVTRWKGSTGPEPISFVSSIENFNTEIVVYAAFL
jgi:hypothetical protein